MKKILLLLVISFFVGKNCNAQNIVPNPSFENTVNCFEPSNWGYFSFSPDYFNLCNGQLPLNAFGFQQAYNLGNAYMGIYTQTAYGLENYREIFGCQLLTHLNIGQKYFVSLKVSLSDCINCSTNNIGVLFSTIPIVFSNPIILPNHAQVYSTNIISDTLNWKIVSGSFVSDSPYNYIFIGNFFDNLNTAHSIINSNPCFAISPDSCVAYYYVDDVCVTADSLACDLNPEGIYNLKETKASFNLYPNPVSEQLTVNCEQVASRIEITNSLGVTVYTESVNLKSKTINLKSFPSGIYFIKLYFGDGTMEVKKFVKQ